jgi:hypothetical protein
MAGKIGVRFISDVWPQGVLLEDFGADEEDAIYTFLLGFSQAMVMLPMQRRKA